MSYWFPLGKLFSSTFSTFLPFFLFYQVHLIINLKKKNMILINYALVSTFGFLTLKIPGSSIWLDFLLLHYLSFQFFFFSAVSAKFKGCFVCFSYLNFLLGSKLRVLNTCHFASRIVLKTPTFTSDNLPAIAQKRNMHKIL